VRPAHATEDVQKGVRLQLGLKVFVVLMVLAVVEWYLMVARVAGLLWWLIVIQVVEAGMIVYYFMHVAQLWRAEEHEPSRH
jgi:cytochrome c oxidase subunit IV